MTISILATCGATQYDLSNWVIKDSIKIDMHLFTDSLEPNTNSAEFVLSRTCPYLDELLAYDDAIGVSIAADGTTYFTGYFTDSFRFSITSRGAQDVKIECEDPGIRKLKTAWVSADGIGTTFAGDKICDPADTAHSVIHKIATLAGVTLASGLPTISQQVYMVVLDKDGRTYWDVLSKLLLEHLYVFDFNAAGQLYLFALTGMTGAPVQTLTTQEGIIGDNSTPGIVVNKRLYDTREIDVRFDEISTIASGVVHRDTTGQTATYDCLIPIAPGAYYPDTCNADTYAYIDYKTEDGRDVVMVDSATLDVSKDSGITAEFANLGKSARIRFYNGGGTTQYIYRLKVNATNIRVKSANSKVIAGETSRHKREIDASTITTKAKAQAFGNLLYYYYKNSKQLYQFRGYRGLLYPSDSLYPSETLYPNGDLIEPGEIIRLYDPIFTGLDATVMVTRKRYTLGRSGAEYDAIGVGEISLGDTVAAIPTTITPAPVPVSQPEIVQIAQTQAVEAISQYSPHYLGLFNYADKDTIIGVIDGDLAVFYHATTASYRGIYQYSTSSGWTKIDTPTQDQIMRCFVGVLDAVRQGYGQSSDYIGTGATSFETLLVNFIYAQYALISGSIRAGTRYDQSGNEANPTQDGVWIGANGKIKGAINDVEPDQVTPSFTRRQLFTSSGTWTVPEHVKWVRVTAIGGGGGGGGSGGATDNGYESTSVVYNGNNGGAGGASTFGSYITANGGSGGAGSGTAGTGASGQNGGSSDYIGGYNGANGGDGSASAKSSASSTGTKTSGAGGARGASAGLYDANVELSNASGALTKIPAISAGASNTNSATSSAGLVVSHGAAGNAGTYGAGGGGATGGCLAVKSSEVYSCAGACGGGGGAGALRQRTFRITEVYGQSITVTVGAGGAGGSAGGGTTALGATGGNGGNGWVLVEW